MKGFLVLFIQVDQPGEMRDLTKHVKEVEALLAAALARIEELETQHRQTSGNSSKPPRSDMSHRKGPKAVTGRTNQADRQDMRGPCGRS